MLSMSIFPLWWSSLSETFGRRAVYLTSFSTFVIWNALAAESTSIGMLIAMRILGGGSSAAVQAVGAGTIADIWESKERGRAMGIFFLGMFRSRHIPFFTRKKILLMLCRTLVRATSGTDNWRWSHR